MLYFAEKSVSVFCVKILVAVACLLLSSCSNDYSYHAEENSVISGESINTSELTAENKKGTLAAETQFIYISGQKHSASCEYLRLSSPNIDVGELYEVLPQFTRLKNADIRGTSVMSYDALELSKAFPDVYFIWNNEVFGTVCSSETLELNISGNKLESTREAESIIGLFPKLNIIVMSDCGITDEDMDFLNKKYENIKCVWTVHFSIYSLRTDAEYFCASDLPNRGYIAPRLNEQQLEPLKYCTDLVALDLGHMNYKNIEFLRDMKKLKYLILVQSMFSDLSPLENMQELEYLELFANNRIVDLSPLLTCSNLKHLNLGYCYYAQWESLKEMKQLERLWLPHVQMTKAEKQELSEALPDTQIYCPNSDRMGSTGGGWREDRSYYDMRDAMHMFYLPGGTGM